MNKTKSNVSIITHSRNWMEQQAINQLYFLAALPGVTQAVGLPDLHPGQVPVGVVIISKGYIYPRLIGSDIGCGMGLFKSGIKTSQTRIEKWVKDIVRSGSFDKRSSNQLENGSIGSGNHFAELQAADRIYDIEKFNEIGLDADELVILVHSGSRKFGQSILNDIKKESEKGLLSNSKLAQVYLEQQKQAIDWARINRLHIAEHLCSVLGRLTKPVQILDNVHNGISVLNNSGEILYIHRKGAAPADDGLVVVPGSRGTFTYLLEPTGEIAKAGYSLAHGAGRKWPRSTCRARLRKQYKYEDLRYNCFKGQVVCHDIDLIYEEAPEAYKNIDIVIEALVDAGLASVIATFKPLLTVKG